MNFQALAVSCALFAAPFVRASEHQVGPQTADLCEVSANASPGDVIVITGALRVSASCTWTAPGVTIRGSEGSTLSAADRNADTALIIAADGVSLEGVTLDGLRLEVSAGEFSIRSATIRNAGIGLSITSQYGKISVENSTFQGNRIDIQASEVDTFSLTASTLSSAGGVTSRARSNLVRDNRFFSENETVTRGFSAINGNSVFENNLFHAATPESATFVSLVSEAGAGQQASLVRNTFVSHAGQGALFVEALGDGHPLLHAEGNVFWGAGAFAVARDPGFAANNYIGNDEIFAGKESFAVDPFGIAAGRGAALAAAEVSVPAQSFGEPETAKNAVRASLAQVHVASITLEKASIAGASFLFGNKVNLSAPAPAGGLVVSIRSSNPAVVLPISPVVIVAAGSSSAQLVLRTFAASNSTEVAISATANGVTASAEMTVGPISLKSMTLESGKLGAHATTLQNRVYLSGPAADSTTVYLSSSNPAVRVPASVVIGAAVNNAAFTITTGAVNSLITATITATHATGKVSATVSVTPAGIKNVLVAPTTIGGGSTGLVSVILNGAAPSGGLRVRLASSDPSVVSVPAELTVPAGLVLWAVPVRTYATSSRRVVTITATDDSGSHEAELTVTPVGVTYLWGATQVESGRTATLFVLLSAPAPEGGQPISVRTSDSALSAPATITVPEGVRYMRFQVSAGSVSTVHRVEVTASAGSGSRSHTVAVLP